MTDGSDLPRDPDAIRAADPATPPEELARIAHLVPALRAVVAQNPSAYPGLRQWIAEQPPVAHPAPAQGAAAAPQLLAPQTAHPARAAGGDTDVAPDQPEAERAEPVVEPDRDADTAPEDRPGRTRRRRGAGLLVGAATLMLLGAVAGGVALGWTALSEVEARRTPSEPAATAEPVDLAPVTSTAAVIMPDVRGLGEDAAREVLTDSGVAPSLVSVSTRPAAGPAGAVVEQTPAFGTEDPDAVTLVLSEQVTVPEAVGMDGAAVVAALGEYGAEVTIEQRYVPGATVGVVQSIDPAPGTPLPNQVLVVVAEPPSSVYLADLDPVDGRCTSGSEGVNGTTYDSSLACRVDRDPTETSWVVSRVVDGFTATVGVPDDGDTGSRVRVEVLADGVVVGSAEAGYGQPAALDATVTGALRLTVRVTLVSATEGSRSSGSAVLADARLVGGADAMQNLGVEP